MSPWPSRHRRSREALPAQDRLAPCLPQVALRPHQRELLQDKEPREAGSSTKPTSPGDRRREVSTCRWDTFTAKHSAPLCSRVHARPFHSGPQPIRVPGRGLAGSEILPAWDATQPGPERAAVTADHRLKRVSALRAASEIRGAPLPRPAFTTGRPKPPARAPAELAGLSLRLAREALPPLAGLRGLQSAVPRLIRQEEQLWASRPCRPPTPGLGPRPPAAAAASPRLRKAAAAAAAAALAAALGRLSRAGPQPNRAAAPWLSSPGGCKEGRAGQAGRPAASSRR